MSILRWLLPASVLVLGCPGPIDSGDPFVAEGPVLEHTPPEGTLIEGDSVDLFVGAIDEDGVADVRVFSRGDGDDSWDWADMTSEGSNWLASLEAEQPGLEYYFKATDQGDPPAVSYLPSDAGAAPFTLDVLVQALELPFYESFDLDDGEDDLRDLGWVSYEADFPGYPWELVDGGPDGGPYVRHAVGNGDETDLMDDWLIEPALDFSQLERIQLSWYEQGSEIDLAVHELWYSTGSRNPADGEFTLLAELDAPGETWERAAIMDLTELAGERVVYLAWRYQGANADSWSIDIVGVEELGADLSAEVETSPAVVHPGETVTIDLVVSNATESDAPDVVVGLYVDMGEGGVVEDSLDLGSIASLGEESGTFDLALADSLPDDSRLVYQITIDSGAQSWSQDFELQLGYPSTAVVDFTLDATALLEVSIGVGDPDDPTEEWAVLTSTEAAGTGSVDVDITDQYDLLPPDAGELRWFARVVSNGSGSVDGFTIETGDAEYDATGLAELVADEELLVYLPEPPAPVVSSWSTSHATLQPGQTDVSFSTMYLRNDGADSSGAVSATLVCEDDGVTLLDAGPVLLSGGTWSAGQTISLLDVFLFDVAEDKVDSEPITFVLVLEDEVESFEIEIEASVPWPVLRIVRVQVEDDDNGDGILDPGETATLEIEVANTGDQGTDGIARGTLSMLGTSSASADIDADDQSFGQIDAADSRSEDFDLVVTTGSTGDTLDLQLTIEDSSATFTPTFQFVLGEPPWLAASAVDDGRGDALDEYEFDWVNAWYRVNEGMFQLRCEATDAVDLGAVFIEAWGNSSGSGFVLYQLVVTGGSADLLGWPDYSSHYSITTPSISADDNLLLIEWDPAAMDLAIDSFSMGFGAGWCGPPSYYCDHFPDGWGYPYDSYSSGSWLDLEW